MTWIRLFNREAKLRPFILSSALKKIRGKWRDGKYTGRIVITGSVEITNGPKHAGPYKNHFVNNALYAFAYVLLSNFVDQNNGSGGYYQMAPASPGTMYLGTNITTTTFPSMQSLISPIGTPPGTGPNSFSRSYGSTTNGYQVVFTATWNPGTVSGTIGEIALYGGAATAYYTGTVYSVNWNNNNVLLSRLSVADGDFTAFTINPSNPLVITWMVQFVFG